MEDNDQFGSSAPRLLRPVETPLALYMRPGRNDHKVTVQALADGLRGIRGIIFNPGQLKVQQELPPRPSAPRSKPSSTLEQSSFPQCREK